VETGISDTMKRFDPILKYAGVTAAVIYVVFTFLSHLSNTAISPMTDWLSNYGSPILNPSGAFLYNLGCISTAAALAVFYTGMSQWYKGHRAERKYVICYIYAQISGLAASCFLIIAALFPIGTSSLHTVFGTMNMIGLDCFISFISIAVIMHPNINISVGIFGFCTSFFNIITTNAFKDLYFAEWIYFILFIIFIVMITINYDKLGWKNQAER
jgi:hypothetical protein